MQDESVFFAQAGEFPKKSTVIEDLSRVWLKDSLIIYTRTVSRHNPKLEELMLGIGSVYAVRDNLEPKLKLSLVHTEK